MTEEERKLLLAIARWVAKREQEESDRLDMSSPMLNELRRLIVAAADSRPADGNPAESRSAETRPAEPRLTDPRVAGLRQTELRRPDSLLLLAKQR